MPWWEELTAGTYASGTANPLNCSGELWTPTVTSGDLSGRISYVQISNMTDTALLDDFWLGIRPTYAGTANYTSLWECEYGTNGTGASDVGASSESNGTVVRVDFTSNSAMVQRLRVSYSQASGTLDDNMSGKYLVLGRIACGASTECLVDLYQGLAQVGSTPQGIELVGETKVTNTEYKLIELGQVQLPPSGLKVFDGTGTNYVDPTLYIYAQRLSGSSYLYLDCLILIPCEHMLTIKNASIDNGADAIYYRSGADGKSIAFMYDSTSERNEIVEHSIVDFNWPSDGGVMVIAAQAASGTIEHDLVANVRVGMYVYPRYSLMKA
jgi:hypothetical protein